MAGIVKLIADVLSSTPMIKTTSVTKTKSSNNPFAQSTGNPFVYSQTNSFTYGQNRPVAGGYFAGYYNNQPNIVGRRLFIEV